ncbi:hypothetical protein HOD19_00505 [bacterium]|jgi:hypothetical protein|nr:hypothetical protein [bacterium]MBT4649447.1 hypothetical protein [bacterium]
MSKLNWWQIIITIITLATFFITRQITDDNVLFEIFTPFVVTLIIVLIALCISSANALITAFVALDSVLIVIAITFFILAFTINSERFFIAAFIALMLITVITIELIFRTLYYAKKNDLPKAYTIWSMAIQSLVIIMPMLYFTWK